MAASSGPFRIFARDSELGNDADEPVRRFACANYSSCLSLAAVLNWDSFSCRNCSGLIDEAILWRAKGASKREVALKDICAIPNPPIVRTPADGSRAAPTRTASPALRSVATGRNREANNG